MIRGRDSLVKGHPQAITEVSMEMSPVFIAEAKENLWDQTVVVFDPFHVIAQVYQALNETRRAKQRLALQMDAKC
ncbi:MAG: transposase [Opitutaceae bacterium]